MVFFHPARTSSIQTYCIETRCYLHKFCIKTHFRLQKECMNIHCIFEVDVSCQQHVVVSKHIVLKHTVVCTRSVSKHIFVCTGCESTCIVSSRSMWVAKKTLLYQSILSEPLCQLYLSRGLGVGGSDCIIGRPDSTYVWCPHEMWCPHEIGRDSWEWGWSSRYSSFELPPRIGGGSFNSGKLNDERKRIFPRM